MIDVIMALKIEPRSSHVPDAQEILTKFGCIIKARIGLHETSNDYCSEKGLIILHILGSEEKVEALKNDLTSIEGVKVNYMKL